MSIRRAAIVNYGCGNLTSISAWLARESVESYVLRTLDDTNRFQPDFVVLPGVGSFGPASHYIRNNGLCEYLIRSSQTIPLLGICLGAQLLLDESDESPGQRGLSLISGKVTENFQQSGSRVGWYYSRTLQHKIPEDYYYFNHSYKLEPPLENVISVSDDVISAIGSISLPILGVQFHPEKSQIAGSKFLQYFLSTYLP